MLPRSEYDTDLSDLRRRTEIRPVTTLAVEREVARERESQTLVDGTLEEEQKVSIPESTFQPVPGEPTYTPFPPERRTAIYEPDRLSNVDRIISVDPEKTVNPVQVPSIGRTTLSRVERLRRGVPVRESIQGIRRFSPIADGKTPKGRTESAFGLAVKEGKIINTPVSRLNFLDQFFNWLNVFLSGGAK